VNIGGKNTQSVFISPNLAGLPALTTGDFNVAIGGNNGQTLETGSNNFSMGFNCMLANKVGSNNCFMGHRSGYSVGFPAIAANYNTGVGDSTLENVLDTVDTTAIGARAGNSIATSSFRNTLIGAGTVCGAALSYATAIGADANVTTSNTIQLGRTADNVNCPNTLSVASNVTASTAPSAAGHLCNKTYVDSKVSLSGNESIAGVKTFTSVPVCATAPSTANELCNKTYVDGAIGGAISGATGFVTTNTAQIITANKTFYGVSLLIDDGSGKNTSISQVNQITVFDNNNLVNTTTTITGIIPSVALNRIVPTDGSNPTTANIIRTTITGANIPIQANRYFVSGHQFNTVQQITTLGQPSGRIGSLNPLTTGTFITSGLGTQFSNGTYVTGFVSAGVYTINQPAIDGSLFKVNVNFSLITTNISLAASTTAGTISFRNDGAFQFLCNNTSGTEIMPLEVNSTNVNIKATTTVGGTGLFMDNGCMYGRDDQFAFLTVPVGAPKQPIGFTTTYYETAVAFTNNTQFTYTTVLPLLDNGVWMVQPYLRLIRGTGTFNAASLIRLSVLNSGSTNYYPEPCQTFHPIPNGATATDVQITMPYTFIVKSAVQERTSIAGIINMAALGTATKALRVSFTKIA
jgi:hypothetical protein